MAQTKLEARAGEQEVRAADAAIYERRCDVMAARYTVCCEVELMLNEKVFPREADGSIVVPDWKVKWLEEAIERQRAAGSALSEAYNKLIDARKQARGE